ncbi:MAG: hypothetical protein D3925_14550, partial [Candidatus Electrothrix sp. AR5]|nr:hypothetical protein [Candidatus Electrothrix sp. AR5]
MSSSDALSHTDVAYEPYIGLRPFEEDERDRFFGRDREINILLDNIRFNRLTLLLAGSGVGKSSLLRAGVMPILGADPATELLYHNTWSGDPAKELKQTVAQHFSKKYNLAPFDEQFAQLPLKDMLRTCTMFTTGQQILLLDQFEEFFNYQRFREGFGDFVEELSAAVGDRSLPASFVFSMREDFALELNAFKEFLPGVFDNYFRLEKLTSKQARLAIEEPLKQTTFRFEAEKDGEKALLDRVLGDLAKREYKGQFGEQEYMRVEPPHLQLVCQELWEHHLDYEAKQITHAAYNQAGETAGILKSYFLRKIGSFSSKKQGIASAAFDHLIGQRSTKIAHPLERLAERTRVTEKDLQGVLDRLQDDAILRRQKRGEQFWYELYHDIFAESIDKWNRDFKADQRMKRFIFGSVAVLLAGGIFFVSHNFWKNNYGRYLQLSAKENFSDRVEVYNGTIKGIDLFSKGSFRYETSSLRHEIQSKELFGTKIIDNPDTLSISMISQKNETEHFLRYMKNGLYDQGYIIVNKKINDLFATDSLKEDVRKIKVRSDRYVRRIVPLLRGDDRRKKTIAIKVISNLNQLSEVSAIAQCLEDSDSEVRSEAIKALAHMGATSRAQEIAAYMDDKEYSVRRAAVAALGTLKYKPAVPAILESLKDNNSNLKQTALKALAELDASSLIPTHNSEYYELQRKAIRSLEKVNRDPVSNDAIQSLKKICR